MNAWKPPTAMHVRARAPLRLGLAGGGTDLSPYCDQFGGAVLNVTIDRFAFAHIMPEEGGGLVFRARDLGVEERYALDDEISTANGLMLHKAVYLHMVARFLGGRRMPMALSTTIDAPAGSGLGSSSALVVAMVEAFRTGLELPLGPYDVARTAFEIERVELGLAGGRQDQYAAAFGGVNFIEFLPGERAIVNPLRIRRDYMMEFESSLVICFSGHSRRSDKIIAEQISGIRELNPETMENLHRLKDDAVEMKQALQRGEMRQMGRILMHSWDAKRRTAAGVSTPLIDRLFTAGLQNGAWAGKVSGAGGGGFLMFCAEPDARAGLIAALDEAGGVASPVKFTMDGAEGWIPPVYETA
jgi:D-glycero-alpha-D-manno-heptose-7-phosphate kinase